MRKIVELNEEDISNIEAALTQISEKVNNIITISLLPQHKEIADSAKEIRKINTWLQEQFDM
jgi:hypothetical protein